MIVIEMLIIFHDIWMYRKQVSFQECNFNKLIKKCPYLQYVCLLLTGSGKRDEQPKARVINSGTRSRN